MADMDLVTAMAQSLMVLAGEWWNADTEKVIQQALQTGGGPNVSDAYTINGFPGPLYNCSSSSNGNCNCVFQQKIFNSRMK